jgi:ATP-dependent DNA ligase
MNLFGETPMQNRRTPFALYPLSFFAFDIMAKEPRDFIQKKNLQRRTTANLRSQILLNWAS